MTNGKAGVYNFVEPGKLGCEVDEMSFYIANNSEGGEVREFFMESCNLAVSRMNI